MSVTVAVGLWLVAAALLWRTRVPSGLHLPRLDANAVLGGHELRRAARHDRFLRWDWVAGTLAELAVLGYLARRPPRAPAAGLAALALVAAWAAQLPLALAAQWWDNRYGLAKGGYGSVLDTTQLTGIGLGCAVLVALIAVARRIGRRWWLVAAPLLAGAAAVLVLVQPLLQSGLRPLGQRVYVEKVSDETTEANAEAIGLGPTRRIVVWDTLLDGRFSDREIRFVLAHERAHLRRDHVLKGLAWFALLVLPATFVISRLVRLEAPGAAAKALLAALAIQLALLPLTNAVSRRYEAEADWLALQRTRDPAAARVLFRDFARTSLQQPDPPGWSYVFLDDHPTLLQRNELAAAWAKARAGAPRGGS